MLFDLSLCVGLISQSEFNCAAATKEGHPDPSYYQGYIQSLPQAQITTKEEAAKFLAHEVWETLGFQFTREQYCMGHMAACATAYPNTKGKPGKVYYGRGMLQLTWDYNYAAASEALYQDDRLIQNPELVADDPVIACATAAWFWSANVHNVAATFGGTLKAINGALECAGGPNEQNGALRFNHYKSVVACLDLPQPSESDGYCSA